MPLSTVSTVGMSLSSCVTLAQLLCVKHTCQYGFSKEKVILSCICIGAWGLFCHPEPTFNQCLLAKD